MASLEARKYNGRRSYCAMRIEFMLHEGRTCGSRQQCRFHWAYAYYHSDYSLQASSARIYHCVIQSDTTVPSSTKLSVSADAGLALSTASYLCHPKDFLRCNSHSITAVNVSSATSTGSFVPTTYFVPMKLCGRGELFKTSPQPVNK